MKRYRRRLTQKDSRLAQTVASFATSSSDAPSDASPISCENSAKFGSRKSGMCPSTSWQQSLLVDRQNTSKYNCYTAAVIGRPLPTLHFSRLFFFILPHDAETRPMPSHGVFSSVRPSRSCILSKRIDISSIFLPSGSHTTLVFGNIPTGSPLNGLSDAISGFIACF